MIRLTQFDGLHRNGRHVAEADHWVGYTVACVVARRWMRWCAVLEHFSMLTSSEKRLEQGCLQSVPRESVSACLIESNGLAR